jgi:hypothetical protein
MATIPSARPAPDSEPVAASSGALTRRLADDAESGTPGFAAARADCCIALPRYRVTFQVPSAPEVRGELLLCGHHYRLSTVTLLGLQASAYDETHRLLVSFA